MITGVGTDIIEVSRIRTALAQRRNFATRIFTDREREYCLASSNPAQHFAGKFAAKEAVAKALGTSLSWQDVEILSDESGRPLVTLLNRAAELAAGRTVLVSISHCRTYAIANATAVLDDA